MSGSLEGSQHERREGGPPRFPGWRAVPAALATGLEGEKGRPKRNRTGGS